jgi:hypothetical protein
MNNVIDEAYPLLKGTDFLKRKKLKKALSDRFTQGYICACANILRNYGDAITTQEVLESVYTSIADLKKCDVEERDIEILMPIIKNIEYKKKMHRIKSHSNNQ